MDANHRCSSRRYPEHERTFRDIDTDRDTDRDVDTDGHRNADTRCDHTTCDAASSNTALATTDRSYAFRAAAWHRRAHSAAERVPYAATDSIAHVATDRIAHAIADAIPHATARSNTHTSRVIRLAG